MAGEQGTERLRVVVVDDQPDFRMLLQHVLGSDDRFDFAGEAANGKEAIALCARVCPDVVVLDLDMPEMDGATALPVIRDGCPAARIFIYSAYTERYQREALEKEGATAVLNKGVPLKELVEVLAGA